MKRKTIPDAWMLEKSSLTIRINEAQRQHLTQLCKTHGEPGVPLAAMAATAFTRGLQILAHEIGTDWLPVPPQ